MTTTPGGAEIYVDDALCGTSDASRGRLLVERLTPGLHSVRVLKEGFNEYKINVALEDGKQTDLQAALAARPTVAMPPAEDTAAGGLETVKLQAADETKTAILVVESLPVGTTLFMGSEPVGRADSDGRATLKLPPGSHEIRVTAPTGASSTRLVSVTPQEAGSRKTISFPLGQTGVVEATTSVSQPEQPRRGKQTAAATAVVLLLVLAAAAYFVLRGPDRTRAQNTSVSAGLATATSPSAEPATRLADTADNQQVSEDKKKAAEAKRQQTRKRRQQRLRRKQQRQRRKPKRKKVHSRPLPHRIRKPRFLLRLLPNRLQKDRMRRAAMDAFCYSAGRK
ncbi:MAG TPA: PEGA domain-containing protein [Blastocatellia bacterium]|nr:PEGA domain-containing protein [Blastocatellia bacterium]